MIYVDVDSVVRDIGILMYKKLKREPHTWEEGSVIFKIVKENPMVLVYADTTKYFNTIKKYLKHPHFLSAQIDSWIPYTNTWLNLYFGKNKYDVIYVDKGEEKLQYLEEGDLLIDDSPKMSDHSKIILIDYIYNQYIKNPYIRIKEPEELDKLLKELS